MFTDNTYFVTLDMLSTMRLLDDVVVRSSFTGVCIDNYGATAPNGGSYMLLVYEKHYNRAGNRLTLTVVLDDFTGQTRVHCIGGGGGEGLFRFDWGASKSFSGLVSKALASYRA